MKRIFSQDGFTLLELVIAMIIMGILASIAVPSYNHYVNNSKIKSNQQFETLLNDALFAYYIENKDYPDWDNGSWDLYNYINNQYRAEGNNYSVIILDSMKSALMNAYCQDPQGMRGKRFEKLVNAPHQYFTWRQADFGIQANVTDGKVKSVTVSKSTAGGC